MSMRALFLQKCVLLCCLLFAMIGCTPRIVGTLEVDGSTFAIKGCRSGHAFGFSGLADEMGRRLRLLRAREGRGRGALFRQCSARGDGVGSWGVLTMTAKASRINGIHNLKGEARLSCDSGSHRIVGNVRFENCH